MLQGTHFVNLCTQWAHKIQRGYPLHRENRENGKEKSLSGKTGNLEILPKHTENTENMVCSSCKFLD